MKLSKNFTLRELTESTTATRLGIDNSPDAQQISNLAELCENVLQPIRDRIGKPIRVTSGFRNIETNRAMWGVIQLRPLPWMCGRCEIDC